MLRVGFGCSSTSTSSLTDNTFRVFSDAEFMAGMRLIEAGGTPPLVLETYSLL